MNKLPGPSPRDDQTREIASSNNAVAPVTVMLGEEGQEEERPPINMIGMLHSILYRRYLPMTLTALVLAFVGAVAGYFATSLEYSSTGMIEFAPKKPSLLYTDKFGEGRLRLYESYIAAEMSYITSAPVLERATDRLEAHLLPKATRADRVLFLRDTVSVDRHGALLLVSASHEKPETAAMIAQAILDSYEFCRMEMVQFRDAARERKLSEREATLVKRLMDTDEQLLETGQEYGSASIAAAHVHKLGQIQAVDERIAEVEMTIASRLIDNSFAEAAADLEAKRIVVLDNAMAHMLAERTKRKADLAVLKAQHAPQHYEIAELDASIVVVDEAIEDRRRQLVTLASTGTLTSVGASGSGEPVAVLQSLLKNLQNRREILGKEANSLNRRVVSINFLQEERDELRNLLDDTRRALDAVRVEGDREFLASAIIKDEASVPTSPVSDKRKELAGVGAAGGAAAGVCLFVVPGFLRFRYRFGDDLRASVSPFVGVIPDLGLDPLFSDERLQQSVARMRCQLDLVANSPNPTRTIVVTGLHHGAGASWVSRTLAQSYESAGLSTLLVDLDIENGATTDLLGLQHEQGLTDFLASRVDVCPSIASSPRLRVIPVGQHSECLDRHLSQRALAKLWQSQEGKVDMIIVDAGTLANRIAPRLASAHGDQILLVVPVGSQANACQKAVRGLRVEPSRICLTLNFALPSDPCLRSDYVDGS